MSVLQFRPYAPDHRERCLAMFDDNCPEFFAPNERSDYAAFLASDPPGYVVVLEHDAVIGAFGLSPAAAARQRLNWILLASHAQGRGAGRTIIVETLRRASERGATVIQIAASHRSTAFFARFGAHATRLTADGWGPGMHRVDMELRLNHTLFTHRGGSIVVPQLVLVDRDDGGHLIVNPPRDVWERSELTADELAQWSFLVAATGRAMLDVLPQLDGGCINYWEAGNWALHDDAEPIGRKDPRAHRRVHLHLLGRSPNAADSSWRWGEAPQFPAFSDRRRWAAPFRPPTADECDAVVARAKHLLSSQYSV